MNDPGDADPCAVASPPQLAEVVREWTRIGCIGFGGPPAHVALLRDLCVQRRWLTAEEFEDAIATTNLLPGPGSTQLAIFCAWRLTGWRGALAGGAGFVGPGLIVTLLLSLLFLAGAPPDWVAGAGAGAGAAVAAVAVQAGAGLLLPGWRRVAAQGGRAGSRTCSPDSPARPRWGRCSWRCCWPAVVVEMIWRRERRTNGAVRLHAWPLAPAVIAAAAATGGLGALAWTAFKVGALAYGGGFVIIPLMQADAVGEHGWMTAAEFLNAVAIGQVTPGPVVHTVAVVAYAAAGIGGALLASVVAFAPSFSFVLLGGGRFHRLRAHAGVRAFLDGAGPAAIGAIVGSAIPLAGALSESWQFVVLAAAAVALLALRRGVVLTLLAAGTVGAVLALLGGPVPGQPG